MKQWISLKVEWNLGDDLWASALSDCPEATYFHSNGWLKAVSRAFGTQLVRARFQLADGRWALLPLSVRPLAKGLVPYAAAGEIGGYSGLVSPYALSGEEVDTIYRSVGSRFPDLRVTGNPLTTQPHVPTALEGTDCQTDSTHMLELQPLEILRLGFSRGCKSRGNKARKQGFEVEITADPKAIDEYYELYLDSTRRWGEKLTWVRPRAFFTEVLAQDSEHARLFLARQNGQAVSGLLFAAHGSCTHYLAGSTRADALNGCPSNLLMEEAMNYYQSRGYRWFDFGPSNGLEGVQQFKESFGARPVEFYATSTTSPAGRMYFSLRSARDRVLAAISPKPTLTPSPSLAS